MRLAVVHNHPSGGAARAIHAFGRELAARNDVDVYTLASGDEDFAPSRDFAARIDVTPFRPTPPRRWMLYLNEVQQIRDLEALERAYRTMARRIDDRDYDAVLVSACRYLQAPSVLAHLRTPAAYYCHEPPRRFLPHPYRAQPARPRGYARLRAAWHRPAQLAIDRVVRGRDLRNVRSARAVLANSGFTAGLVASYYRRDATVCHPGVDARAFQPADGSGGYVLSVGAIERHKGFDFLVESLASVAAERRPPLLIAGNNANPEYHAELLHLAAAREVRLTARLALTEAQLADTYARAAVFAYAPRYEPFGLAVLEAMGSALPVVAVAEGGPNETVIDGVTGVLVPRDAAAFGAAIARLAADRRLSAELGEAARGHAATSWTWDAAARRVEAALGGIARAVAAAEPLLEAVR